MWTLKQILFYHKCAYIEKKVSLPPREWRNSCKQDNKTDESEESNGEDGGITEEDKIGKSKKAQREDRSSTRKNQTDGSKEIGGKVKKNFNGGKYGRWKWRNCGTGWKGGNKETVVKECLSSLTVLLVTY